jgi:hypothetical protein
MLLDLGRNDVGRVSVAGSVKVGPPRGAPAGSWNARKPCRAVVPTVRLPPS